MRLAFVRGGDRPHETLADLTEEDLKEVGLPARTPAGRCGVPFKRLLRTIPIHVSPEVQRQQEPAVA